MFRSDDVTANKTRGERTRVVDRMRAKKRRHSRLYSSVAAERRALRSRDRASVNLRPRASCRDQLPAALVGSFLRPPQNSICHSDLMYVPTSVSGFTRAAISQARELSCRTARLAPLRSGSRNLPSRLVPSRSASSSKGFDASRSLNAPSHLPHKPKAWRAPPPLLPSLISARMAAGDPLSGEQRRGWRRPQAIRFACL